MDVKICLRLVVVQFEISPLAPIFYWAFQDKAGWYDSQKIFQELADAKAAIIALRMIPFQRRWVEELQKIQLKMEVGGSSKIEGADFAGNELEAAMKAETAEELRTRSQKQANA